MTDVRLPSERSIDARNTAAWKIAVWTDAIRKVKQKDYVSVMVADLGVKPPDAHARPSRVGFAKPTEEERNAMSQDVRKLRIKIENVEGTEVDVVDPE